ncbi:BrnT family toxin [Rhizobium panacihumi]|uniref:BrnT family toxin n=1 Tax=Rhizobium panacihumi TaxID=2008450 RepID=UPI003D7A3CD9
MRIVWDERKRQVNLLKHGLDFADLDLEFFVAAVTSPAKEGRSKAVGRLRDGTIVVIFLALGSEAISIISMRPARRDEREVIE